MEQLRKIHDMGHDQGIEYLKKVTRSIADYPKPGIVFRDLTTVFQDPKAYAIALERLTDKLRVSQGSLLEFDKLAGIEARGFVLAGALAASLKKGVVVLRKPGKLPYEKISVSYDLEYGQDSLEVHVDAIAKGERVVVVDDLLATGGTAEAACALVEKLGGVVVRVLFLVDLPELGGWEKLSRFELSSVMSFEGH